MPFISLQSLGLFVIFFFVLLFDVDADALLQACLASTPNLMRKCTHAGGLSFGHHHFHDHTQCCSLRSSVLVRRELMSIFIRYSHTDLREECRLHPQDGAHRKPFVCPMFVPVGTLSLVPMDSEARMQLTVAFDCAMRLYCIYVCDSRSLCSSRDGHPIITFTLSSSLAFDKRSQRIRLITS
ncbi:hypothetical protein BCV70DRAFT_76730 [Testicularia cyperi]|uniref:Secreted protein n=1 Tax=Testicularia cyperi TaxID=1882483 RepID=A0A317XW56_9BASI|nr:hypothetical protein BCV70DRAFT_76730 [Testicularia cyperi]